MTDDKMEKLKKISSFKNEAEFNEYKDVLIKAAKDIAYKPFTKTGFYGRHKKEIQRLVCMTKAETLDGEIWCPNPKYNVEVSDYGRVQKDGCIFNQFEECELDGYLQVVLPSDEIVYVYRLVAETFKPVKELAQTDYHGYAVHHINENGHENTPENLIWLTNEQHHLVH